MWSAGVSVSVSVSMVRMKGTSYLWLVDDNLHRLCWYIKSGWRATGHHGPSKGCKLVVVVVVVSSDQEQRFLLCEQRRS